MEEKKGFEDLKTPKPKNQGNLPQAPKNRMWIYIVLVGIFLAFTFIDFGSSSKEIGRDVFEKELLPSNDIEKIVIVNKDRVDIYIKADRLADEKHKEVSKSGPFSFSGNKGPHYYFKIGDVETFERQLAEAQVDKDPEQKLTAQY
ncbi:MAG: ATP-dependent metallopeptidase FtsH/Yme1/Tma family protein, partial [Bacteroidales bacterium]|nr:ATP-dependent metallopeptidase FtsH/Yme1/Tma family protein [Bacteroidales bacterium]